MELSSLQAALQRAGARWQAAATSLSALPPQQRRLRLGANPPGGLQTLQQREQAASAKAAAAKGQIKSGLPSSFDLRNVNGADYVTPIEDQGNCGSCVAFSTTATVETTFRWQRGNPNLAVDLSEAQLFYCIAASENANCETGWWPDQALDGYKNNGIADAACFPYTDHDQACNLCSDWQSRAIKITGWHKIENASDMKSWLSSHGPLSACFSVYDDFYSYSSGVYTHISGNLEGGHCVSVIGYDDNQGCWICKNSWGTGWGESGFFMIAYGQCGIDAEMWAVEGIVETMWLDNCTVTGLYASDKDRNAWAYLDGIGWRQVASNDNSIFYDLLSQLVAAKATGRPCNIYVNQGVITQIYVL
jgi:C1A family cysteine protease